MTLTDRTFVLVLVAAIGAAILWRKTPAHAAPVDTAGAALAATMGVPSVLPTLVAEAVVGMSYAPGDGDPGPALYCAAYPGTRPRMPPIPSAVQ